MADSLHRAVAQTLSYSRTFGLPLTLEKLHLWLISSKPIAKETLVPLAPDLTTKDKRLLRQRALYSQTKLTKATQIARYLGYWPPIKLICVTGSLAVDNARQYDDLDIMIVTSANTLWLTRPIIVFFLKITHLRRQPSLPEHHSEIVSDKVCDNLWLDETALSLPKNKQNLYTAHEVLQAKPLFDRGNIYAKFISSNRWTSKYLANAYKFASSSVSSPKLGEEAPLPRGGEVFAKAAGWLLKALNFVSYKIQYHYMKGKITRETITLHSAYFHPNDYNAKLNLDG